MTVSDTDFDGCTRACRKAAEHTRVWGECEFGVKSEPTVSMSKVFCDTDGHNSIGFDVYDLEQLAGLIEPALRRVSIRLGPNSAELARRGEPFRFSGGEAWAIAREVAHAVIHRNDKEDA